MNQTMAIELPLSVNCLTMLHRSKTIRVLHVDDDVLSLDVTKEFLTNEGCFEVDSVSSVDEALRRIAGNNFDVIISDYEMPQKNGLDFLRLLKDGRYEIPFVLFTGKSREEVAIKALNMGADGYFDKQGQPETVYGELAHGIRQIVRTARAEKQHKEGDYLNQKMLDSSPNLIYIYMT